MDMPFDSLTVLADTLQSETEATMINLPELRRIADSLPTEEADWTTEDAEGALLAPLAIYAESLRNAAIHQDHAGVLNASTLIKGFVAALDTVFGERTTTAAA